MQRRGVAARQELSLMSGGGGGRRGSQELKPAGPSGPGNQGWQPPTPRHQGCVKAPFREPLEPRSGAGGGREDGAHGRGSRGGFETAPTSYRLWRTPRDPRVHLSRCLPLQDKLSEQLTSGAGPGQAEELVPSAADRAPASAASRLALRLVSLSEGRFLASFQPRPSGVMNPAVVQAKGRGAGGSSLRCRA